MRLRHAPAAVAEAAAAREWYADENPAAADAFVDALRQTFDRIAESPRLYAIGEDGFRAAPVHRFPFRVHSQDSRG